MTDEYLKGIIARDRLNTRNHMRNSLASKRGSTPAEMEAEARVRSPELRMRVAPENPCAEVPGSEFSPLRGVPVNENVLEIKVTRFCKGTYHAYYVGEKSLGVGSTPFMAVHALINAFNTTDVWNGRYGFD